MSQLLYKSTRSKDGYITSSEAIVKGLAEDGGLFVPLEIPLIDKNLSELQNMDYRSLAFYIMSKFLTDFSHDELRKCIENAYDEKFETQSIAPITKKGDTYFLELYHGPTLAFKDMALSILPHLLKTAAKKTNIKEEIVILTATSGDTGKAALEGFENVDGTKIIVFFPETGVSDIQKRQMTTQTGENTYVVGIKGNFDDAQNGVKEIFNDELFNKELMDMGYRFSSANSINIGRLIPQIVYYFYSYISLLKNQEIEEGEKINVCVPTGNFGNILAAYYAKQMGLPVNKFLCASNINNVLYDFLNTGIYDKRRDFKKTISPSMDILISSNLERLLFELSHKDENIILELMKNLNNEGIYEITDEMKLGLLDFYSGFATDYESISAIYDVYNKYNYIIDPHTAVAYHVYQEYKSSTNDKTKTIIASTASPYKFTRSVMESIASNVDILDDFQLIEEMSKVTGVNIPKNIKDIDKRKVLHTKVCDKADMKDVIKEILEK